MKTRSQKKKVSLINDHIGAASPSTRPGMGATLFENGATFRVWAPFATRVSVMGSFNAFSKTRNPLASEKNGYWSGDIQGVKPQDQYKFFIQNNDLKFEKIDPYAKDVTHSDGNTVIIDDAFQWDKKPFQIPPWNEMVIYEMHIGTFNDRPNDAPGNLNTAINRLTHLKQLGVNALQIMPPYEFAGEYSWGYNPAHIFAFEESYGGPDEFKHFVQAAHRHGMAVILDVVYNHFGPSDLDLWQFDGWQENNKGGIYFYNDRRSKTPWGDTRPDYGRPEVRQFIRDNALMWLLEYRIDGLRWDATDYIRNADGNDNDPARDIPAGWGLMQSINEEMNIKQPWKIKIAEDLRNNAWLTKTPQAGGAGFDSQWDARFVHPVREAIITPDDQHRDIDAVRDAILHRYDTDVIQRVIYTESHDEVANGKARVPHEIWIEHPDSYFSKKRSTLGAALVMTSPGIPMIFQGQEFLEDEWFRDTDPIDWQKAERFSGILNLYQDLIALRKNANGRTRGLCGQHVNVHHSNHQDKLIAFHRWEHGGPGDDVLVLINLGNRAYADYTMGFPREGTWRVRFNSDWQGYSADFGNHNSFDTRAYSNFKDGMPCTGGVGIGAYSAVILSQDQ